MRFIWYPEASRDKHIGRKFASFAVWTTVDGCGASWGWCGDNAQRNFCEERYKNVRKCVANLWTRTFCCFVVAYFSCLGGRLRKNFRKPRKYVIKCTYLVYVKFTFTLEYFYDHPEYAFAINFYCQLHSPLLCEFIIVWRKISLRK